MEALATLAALAAVAVLAIVIVSVLIKGIGAINLDFFIHSEVPFGQTGGGIANAIVGTRGARRARQRDGGPAWGS